MRVDLPSSTEPAVAILNKALIAAPRGHSRCSGPSSPRAAPSSRPASPAPCGSSRERSSRSLEVALFLAVFHAGFGDAVVGAGGAALGEPGGGDLDDDVVRVRRRRLDAAGAGGVADGAEPDGRLERGLAVHGLDEAVDREQHAVAFDDLALVGVVEVGQLDLLVADVGPDVELGPVGEGEGADVLALAVPAVVEVPQLGALVARVPLAELVAEAEDPLLGPGLLLVAPGPAEDGAELVLADAAK